MNLSNHQSEIAEQVIASLMKEEITVLQGSAGVGKTYLADYLVGKLPGKTLCSAPTNKAVAVIKNKVKNNAEFSTIHSALQMKMKYFGSEKKFVPVEGRNPIFKGIRNIIVDEASMIGEELLGYIIHYAKKAGCRVLFLGDDKQINPVKEVNSPVFHQGYNIFSLTEIVRQGQGNPIIELSRNLSLAKTGESKLIGFDDKMSGYLFNNELDRVVDNLAEINGTDDLKYLAWTNKEVDRVNSLVRNRIYHNPAKIEQGESLIFDSPYFNVDGEMTKTTNEEIRVETVDVLTKKFSLPISSNFITKERTEREYEFKVYHINADDKGGVYVIHEDSEGAYTSLFYTMSNACKQRQLEWRDKDIALSVFAKVKYNHAITVHKSQGSTYKDTIVNVADISRNRSNVERDRLLYTAVTRASNLLIIYGM
jgi:hypothetical protein